MKSIGPYVAARELPGRTGSPVRTLRATDRLTGMPVLLHVLPYPPALPELPEHPHVLPVVDSGVDGDHGYLVTELPLQARPASDALLTARGALSALAALHGRGVVHGGLSPAQLWSVDGHVLLTGAGLPWGGDPGPADDLYALAVILSEMGPLPAALRPLAEQPGTLSAAQALSRLNATPGTQAAPPVTADPLPAQPLPPATPLPAAPLPAAPLPERPVPEAAPSEPTRPQAPHAQAEAAARLPGPPSAPVETEWLSRTPPSPTSGQAPADPVAAASAAAETGAPVETGATVEPPAPDAGAAHDGSPIVLGDPVEPGDPVALTKPGAPVVEAGAAPEPETPQERRRRQNEERRAQAILDAQAAAARRAAQRRDQQEPPVAARTVRIGFGGADGEDLPAWTPASGSDGPGGNDGVTEGSGGGLPRRLNLRDVDRLPPGLRRDPLPEPEPEPAPRLPARRAPGDPIRIGWDEDDSWRVVREAPAAPPVRRRWPRWALLVAALALLIGGTWWALRGPGSGDARVRSVAASVPTTGGAVPEDTMSEGAVSGAAEASPCCPVEFIVQGGGNVRLALTVQDAPADANLTPGQEFGSAPGRVLFPVSGTYRLTVTASGYAPGTLSVTVPRETRKEIVLGE
ncbi:hypothetical protein [Deinococcus sp. LM3]|uniref:hypothetical protein n=1 Tax=Deinococcus sp. LM3 TaxID=1938608 RepID=UPI0009D18E75|nr:hypothetical protein [Deinococcus sp. LM3]OOV15050.1 hypothetical protein BXU09_10700 [Deinococcus sp. LM3]